MHNELYLQSVQHFCESTKKLNPKARSSGSPHSYVVVMDSRDWAGECTTREIGFQARAQKIHPMATRIEGTNGRNNAFTWFPRFYVGFQCKTKK